MESGAFHNYCLPSFVVYVRNRLPYRYRIAITAGLLSSIVVAYYFLLVPATSGNGFPVFVTCNKVISWQANITCGINAQDCNPFETDWRSYRCPSSCLHSGSVLTPIGSGPYRGDSGICLAAIHSGVISANKGGCFYLRRSGWHKYFTASSQNGISSVEYRAPYPLTYELREDPSSSFCYDFSFSIIMPLFFFIIAMMVMLGIPEVFLWIILICNAALYTAGPISASLSAFDIAVKLQTSLIAFGGFIWLLWDHGGRTHFSGVLDTPMKLLAFYIIPFFVTLHLDYARVINRDFDLTLSSSFFNVANPTSILFNMGVLLAIILSSVYLVYHLFKSNSLKPVALQYLKFIVPISVLIALIGVATAGSFHLHHYILPLIIWGLIAAVDKPTPWSMLIQSVLLALFVNGAIEWGMAPLFDITSDDADYGSWQPTITVVPDQDVNNNTELIVQWMKDGNYSNVIYSLQLNMIETYRGPANNFTLKNIVTDERFIHELCVAQVWYGEMMPCIGQTLFQFANSSSINIIS